MRKNNWIYISSSHNFNWEMNEEINICTLAVRARLGTMMIWYRRKVYEPVSVRWLNSTPISARLPVNETKKCAYFHHRRCRNFPLFSLQSRYRASARRVSDDESAAKVEIVMLLWLALLFGECMHIPTIKWSYTRPYFLPPPQLAPPQHMLCKCDDDQLRSCAERRKKRLSQLNSVLLLQPVQHN